MREGLLMEPGRKQHQTTWAATVWGKLVFSETVCRGAVPSFELPGERTDFALFSEVPPNSSCQAEKNFAAAPLAPPTRDRYAIHA
jgi:hypothetical protein